MLKLFLFSSSKWYKKEEARLIKELQEVEKSFINATPEEAVNISTKYTVEKLKKAYNDATLIYKELNTYFFDLACDGVYKEDYELRTPFVPSLLGEERLVEIYKEHGIPLESGPAQPLEKPGETQNKTAIPSPQKVIINGENSLLQGYLLDDSIYYKLRDLAAALADTESQFAIEYDATSGNIEIKPGSTYSKLDSDLLPLDDAEVNAKRSNQAVAIGGEEFSITGYAINGYNYFKLEDIAKYINCNISYDESNVILTTK